MYLKSDSLAGLSLVDPSLKVMAVAPHACSISIIKERVTIVGRLRDDLFSLPCYSGIDEQVHNEFRIKENEMFTKANPRNLVLPLLFVFLVALAAALFLDPSVTTFSGITSISFKSDVAENELSSQRYVHNWDGNPAAYVPESTMLSRPAGYVHNWDDNSAAYIPESTMLSRRAGYVHNWDGNAVAYVPESTMLSRPAGYVHNWDDNPAAYIPESTMPGMSTGYVYNWDDNPAAYIPETTMLSKPAAYVNNWDDNPVAYIPETTMIEQP